MKGLIAVTCIAVLAAVGYHFWGEYARHSAQEAAIERQSMVRGCEKWAEIDPDGSVAEGCRIKGYIK